MSPTAITPDDDFLVGPFEEWRVIIEGREIPRLTGYRQSDGRVTLILDKRFMVDFPDATVARQAAWLVANALAIGEGYPCLSATAKERPFAPLCSRLDVVPDLKLVPKPSVALAPSPPSAADTGGATHG